MENTYRVKDMEKFYLTFCNIGLEVCVSRIFGEDFFSLEYDKQPWFDFNVPDELLAKRLDEEQAQRLLDEFFIRMNTHPDWYNFDFEIMN